MDRDVKRFKTCLHRRNMVGKNIEKLYYNGLYVENTLTDVLLLASLQIVTINRGYDEKLVDFPMNFS